MPVNEDMLTVACVGLLVSSLTNAPNITTMNTSKPTMKIGCIKPINYNGNIQRSASIASYYAETGHGDACIQHRY
jgi:hypothetical protein